MSNNVSPLSSSVSLEDLSMLHSLPKTSIISWGSLLDIFLDLFTIYISKSTKRKVYVVHGQRPKIKIYFRMSKKQATRKLNRILEQLQRMMEWTNRRKLKQNKLIFLVDNFFLSQRNSASICSFMYHKI